MIADEDDVVSNLKLQKLCYYAQGFCLAERGSPLFAERLERWQHGPVVRGLYHAFKQYDHNPIPRPASIRMSTYPEAALELMDRVYAEYGRYDAWALRNMTHREAPWAESPPSGVISKPRLRKYFKTKELPPDDEMLRFRRSALRNATLAAMTAQGFEDLDALRMGSVSDS